MQDKDLDNLFQSSLDGLEVEPSAQVWGRIADKLDADKRKRSILPLLSIAASILLLFTGGLLFIPKMVKVNHTDPVKIAKNEIRVKAVPIVKLPSVAGVAHPQNKKQAKAVIAAVNSLAGIKNKVNNRKPVYKPNILDTIVKRQPNEPELALASLGTKDEAVATNKVEVMVPVNNLLTRENNQQQPQGKSKSKPVKKHRIRSLGDVFNVMIAAVDKRKDKFIEFSNTDEDDATITGLNLGIIKVKKEK
ncbi:hypothetical protein [Mucilaginibacter sp.]|uniref:hypothetical protein n=1 Tax=Mucilaginibacter sp. TaxID=1882438 RepID=UPI0031B5DB5D